MPTPARRATCGRSACSSGKPSPTAIRSGGCRSRRSPVRSRRGPAACLRAAWASTTARRSRGHRARARSRDTTYSARPGRRATERTPHRPRAPEGQGAREAARREGGRTCAAARASTRPGCARSRHHPPRRDPGAVLATGARGGARRRAAAAAWVDPRLGLAVALAAPVFPIGNVAASAAILYGAFALAWIVLSWRDARHGLLFVAGPLLATVGLLPLVPLVLQRAQGTARRAAQVRSPSSRPPSSRACR